MIKHMKTCSKCKTEKLLNDFPNNKTNKDGKNYWCRKCWNEFCRKRKKKYSLEEQRKWYKYRPESAKKAVNEWNRKNPEKRQAHKLVEQAIKRGEIIREVCIECGESRTDAHHDDYTKPLEVRWLCRLHHKQTHKITNLVRRIPEVHH